MFAGLCSARRTRRGCTGRRSSGWSWAATRRAGGPAPGRPARPSTAPRRRSASADHSSSDVIICSFPWYKSPSKDWSHCFSLCWMWWWDTSWVLLSRGTPHLTFLFYFAANLFFNFHFEKALQCCWQPLDNPSRWPMVQWSLKFRLIWKYLSLFLSSSHKNVTCTFVTTSVSDSGQVQTNCCEIEKKCEMSQWKKEMRRC